MDIKHIFTLITSLPAERKKELMEKYESDSLSESETEELREHLLKTTVRLEQERIIAEDLAQIAD